MCGLNLVVIRGKSIFIFDTSVIEYPHAIKLVDNELSAAPAHKPRVLDEHAPPNPATVLSPKSVEIPVVEIVI